MSGKLNAKRGRGAERLVEVSNEFYRRRGLALIFKSYPSVVFQGSKKIIAHPTQKGPPDYIGICRFEVGSPPIPVCFEVKSRRSGYISASQIAEHQIETLKEWEKNAGCAFILIEYGRIWGLLPASWIEKGKGWKIEELPRVKSKRVPVDWLNTLKEIGYGVAEEPKT